MFTDKNNPTMAELVNFMQIEFTPLCNSMKASDHAATDNEPNPYHLEDSVWTHTMMVCLQAQNANKIGKICAALHDTGKPDAREVIPFNKAKPTHTPSNEIREADKTNSKTAELGREFKTHFRGHEGISFYKSMDILKKLKKEGVVNDQEIEEILTIISLHGTLFDSIRDGVEFKPEKVAKKWNNKAKMFKNFVNQVRYDSTGRFSPSQDARSATGSALGTTLYGPAFIKSNLTQYKDTEYDFGVPVHPNTITVLVGVPLCGKSTWLEYNKGEATVISRDTTMLDFGRLKYGSGVAGAEPLNYREVWNSLSDDDHKQVDRMIRNQYEIAVKSKVDIIIDMTNTSKKSRGKWLNNIKGYNKTAVVFATGFDEIMKRNVTRFEKEGKFIPETVIINMQKAFMVPMHDEVDQIKFVIDKS